MNVLGLMQGRLTSPTSHKIQEFPWENWQKEFEILNQINLRLLEWTLDLENLDHNPIISDNNSEEIKNLKQKYQIGINSITFDNLLDAPLHRVNTRTNMMTSLDKFQKIVKKLVFNGIEIGVVPLVKESGKDNKETLEKLIEILFQIHPFLKSVGFKIALECELDLVQIEFLESQTSNLNFIGFNFDMGNSASIGNNPSDEIGIIGKRLFNVHIKDRLKNGKTVPLGEGSVDFYAVEKVLRDYKYLGNMILQAARQKSQDEIETILKYIKFCSDYGWI